MVKRAKNALNKTLKNASNCPSLILKLKNKKNCHIIEKEVKEEIKCKNNADRNEPLNQIIEKMGWDA